MARCFSLDSRLRFWSIIVLLLVYLTGVFILSAVSLHSSKNDANKISPDANRQQLSKIGKLEYGLQGLKSPLRRSKINWCTDLKYLDLPRPSVALASYPGSGNTWLRYLLQQATGIYTGSVYKDYGLLKNGFPAENVSDGSVSLVKTHEWGPRARAKFSKAILLVRAPAAAIQAEFNRQSGGHIGFATPDRYRRTRGRFWQQFVSEKLKGWQQMNLDWLYNFTGPTHIIFYEQLVKNVEDTLKTVINFIEIPIDEALFACAIERQEGIYRRKKRILNFDPYTPKMNESLRRIQEQVFGAIYNFAAPAASRKR